MGIEIAVVSTLLLFSAFITTTTSVVYVAENIDELVSKPKYNSVTDFNNPLFLTSIIKPTVVELDMLATEVLSQTEIKTLPYYHLLSREFLLGFPCVESSGVMVFKGNKTVNSIFTDLVFSSENETTDGYESKVKGIYQIKGAGSTSRWLRFAFASKYATEALSFNKPDRPNQFYLPDVIYSISYAFAKTEFGNVESRYGSYINKYAQEYGITEEQVNEVKQSLACAVYHGQRESGGAVSSETIRDTLSKYLVCAVKEVGTFKNLAPYAGEDFHSTLRKVILGESSKGDILNDKYKNKIKLTSGDFLNEPLISYISKKYSNGEILRVYNILYNDTSTYQSQFLNFGYGIGTIACGHMRANIVDNFISQFNVDVSDNPQFIAVKEFMQSNGLLFTKNYVTLSDLKDYSGGHIVRKIQSSVTYMGKEYQFPLFCFDYGARNESGTIKIRYNIASHPSNRGFLYDIPDQLCIGGRNTYGLTCDIRVIPALYSMAKAWEDYDNSNKKTGQKIVVESAFRTPEQQRRLVVKWANYFALGGRSNWSESEIDIIVSRAYTESGDLYKTNQASQLRKYAAAPGKSSHETGRVFDFDISGNPSVYEWLVKNAASFGFYPYSVEPWHWEYNPKLSGE